MEFRREERVNEFYQISTFLPHEDECERGKAMGRSVYRAFFGDFTALWSFETASAYENLLHNLLFIHLYLAIARKRVIRAWFESERSRGPRGLAGL
jgi:hypothetical protein